MKKNELTLFRTQAYLNGEFVDANSKQTLEVINPATGEVLGTVPNMGAAECDDAIKGAAFAFLSWSKMLAKQRFEYMVNWQKLILEHLEEIAHILVMENGKPLSEARAEVTQCAAFVGWFAEEGRRVYGDIIPPVRAATEIRVTKQPIGVSVAITPWNFPAAMVTRKCAAALAAGCSMIIKPSELTPYTALALVALADKAGIPAGVLNLITGEPEIIGKTLASDSRVKKMSFTGSTRVGKLLIKQSADTVKKLSLELGGNAPFIIFDDANIRQSVAELMTSKFRNSGQTCICANRVYIQKNIYSDVMEALLPEVRNLKVGNGLDEGVTQGPLINEAAVQKVEKHIAESVKLGAKVLCGGKKHSLGGTFFEPSILTEVPNDAPFEYEEVFGPVLPVYVFEDEEEVVRMANASQHGLAAYFCTDNMHRAYRVSAGLEAGLVGVNCGLLSTEVAPFGGMKESGFGREGSKYGIDEYLALKYTLFNYAE